MKQESGISFDFQETQGSKFSVPVTPAQDSSPNGAYTIQLTDGTRSLLLVAEKHQNWFRGIVTENDERYEITKKMPKIMAGSHSLHTTGMYHDLIGDTVDKLKIGYSPFVDAFYTLVNHVPGDQRDYRTAIAVVLVMLFEGPRFAELYERNLRLLKEKTDEVVGKDGQYLINQWANICEDFFRENGDNKTVTLSDEANPGFKKMWEGLRILCWTRWEDWQKDNKATTSKLSKSKKQTVHIGGSSSRK